MTFQVTKIPERSGNFETFIAKLAVQRDRSDLISYYPCRCCAVVDYCAPCWKYFGAGSGKPALCLADTNATELQALQNLHQGRVLERDGLIEAAVKEYTAALTAKSPTIVSNSVASLDRIREKREELGLLFNVAAFGASLSVYLRTPVAVSLVLIALAGLLAFVLPRTGSQMGEFPVSGSFDAGATRGFQTAFLRFSNEIRRRYSSEFARRFGMVLSFDVYEGAPVAGADAFERALAEAGTLETKAVAGLVLTGVTRWVAQLTSRPAILVTGSIQFLPGGARASARLLDLHSGRDTLIDATTEELSTLQNKVNGIEALLGRVQPPTSASPSAKAEDLRQTADQLAALALVLACKIRYLESQTAGASYRPSSWETVCVFTAACAKLD